MGKLAAVVTEDAPAPLGCYSQGIAVGGLVFVSGQIPVDPNSGEMIRGNIEAQIEQVLKNINAILEAAGSSLKRVVKTSVFLHDLKDAPKVNAVYEKYFRGVRPAREMVEVSQLPQDAALEISAVAVSMQGL